MRPRPSSSFRPMVYVYFDSIPVRESDISTMLEIILSLFLFPQTAKDNYTQVVETLQKIAAEHSTTAQVFNLGLSDSGRQIVGLKIGNGEIADLIVGTHHGNEYGSTAVALGAAESLAENPLPGHTVYVIPVLNISGYNSRSRWERVGNATLDPNRDYPGPCATEGPFRSKATKALADFVEQTNIVSSATLHTFAPAVLYPWGFSTKDVETRYDSTFIDLSKAATVESGYEVGNSNLALYAADGTFEDYAFWKHGVWSLLFEMGRSHSPSQDEIQRMVAVNVPGLRRFLERAPTQRAADHAFTGKCDFSAIKRTRLE